MSTTLFRAVTIDVDGSAEAVQWDVSAGTLQPLQEAVDGFVDVVTLHPSVTMWVNDEGLVRNMPMNIVATSIARGFGLMHQPYFGRAVFTGGASDEGDTLALSEEQSEALLNLARLARLQLDV